MPTDQQLASLTDAYNILDRAASATAQYAALRPFKTVIDARKYIREQADALLAPIFTAEEN